jgi:membrane-associated phospholipid phosphatase
MKEILYDWGGANVWLFHEINDLRAGWLDGFMQIGSWLGDHECFPLYAAALALIALIRVARRDVAHGPTIGWLGVLTVFCVANVLDGALVTFLKDWLDFPRPAAVLPSNTVFVIGELDYRHSLPSGHAAFTMTLAASLWPVLPRWARYAAGAFVGWVGLSRVSVGAHFPADVVAGFLLALGVVVLVRRTLHAALVRLSPR